MKLLAALALVVLASGPALAAPPADDAADWYYPQWLAEGK
jgi:hypothetical protein